MKAITIQQPWAHLIIHGYFYPQTGSVRRKDVENRDWRSKYRGPLLIHAGKGTDYLDDDDLEMYGLKVSDLAFGKVIGIVEMFDCLGLRDCPDSQWAGGAAFCHLYRNPRPIDPIPWKGALGLWDVPEELLAMIQGRPVLA